MTIEALLAIAAIVVVVIDLLVNRAVSLLHVAVALVALAILTTFFA